MPNIAIVEGTSEVDSLGINLEPVSNELACFGLSIRVNKAGRLFKTLSKGL